VEEKYNGDVTARGMQRTRGEAGTAVRRTVVPRIQAALPSLKPAEARVAEFVLENPEAVIYSSVAEVAEAAQTSTATVVRCAQELGFRGFHRLKLAVAQDFAVFGSEGGIPPESEESPLLRVTALAAQTVRDAGSLVDRAEFDRATQVLSTARHVLMVGVGTSAPLALDGAYRFRTIGIHAEAFADVHMQHVAAHGLARGDVCVAISHTGSTRETIYSVERAAAQRAGTVVITSFTKSPITEHAGIVLTAGGREVSSRLEAMASRLAHMAVLDALLVGVAEFDPERTSAALEAYTDVVADHRL
jgi:DNA-binding MurR/RpiR family transcriptional regulator